MVLPLPEEKDLTSILAADPSQEPAPPGPELRSASEGLVAMSQVPATKKRRRLVFRHLAGIAVPTDHITFARALDEIGRHDYETWGTQRAFAFMPITQPRDRELVGLAVSVTSLGTWNKIVEVELPAEVVGPSSGALRRQFQSVRNALKDAISRGEVRARYHKTDTDLSLLPAALCSSRPRATMMLGIARNEKGRYRPIFVDKGDFDRWMAIRRQAEGTGAAPRTNIARRAISDIAVAIDHVAEETKWYPTSKVLTGIIQEAARACGRNALYPEDVKRIRRELSSVFRRAGIRPKDRTDNITMHQKKFLSAIRKVMERH